MTMMRSLLLLLAVTSVAAHTNVYGSELASCSSAGMALTGYTRTGDCVSTESDQGSHHVCMNLSSTSGGNFCTVTGQPDWCSSSMECHEGSGSCPIQDWCVCEWAFAGYIEKAGGCDAIQDLKCDAINSDVIKAYKKVADQKLYSDALACIVKRCNLENVQDS